MQHLEGFNVAEGGKDQSTGEYFLDKDNMDSAGDARPLRTGDAGDPNDRPAEIQEKVAQAAGAPGDGDRSIEHATA